MTLTKVMEDLQVVLHDLQDLSARSGQPFRGIVIRDLVVQWRDQGAAPWTIRIEPARPESQQTEELAADEIPEPEEEVVSEEEEVDTNS